MRGPKRLWKEHKPNTQAQRHLRADCRDVFCNSLALRSGRAQKEKHDSAGSIGFLYAAAAWGCLAGMLVPALGISIMHAWLGAICDLLSQNILG